MSLVADMMPITSEHFLGLRLNFYVAGALTAGWFCPLQSLPAHGWLRQDVLFAPRRVAGAPSLGRVSSYRQRARPPGTVVPASPARRASAHRRPTGLLRQVGLARLLSGRSWQLAGEVAKFGIVGGTAALVAGIGTNLLHFQFGAGPLISNVIATAAATALSYAGSRYWTFRHRQRTSVRRESIVFLALNGIGLLIQLACLGFGSYVLGLRDRLSYNVVLITGIGLATLFRYAAYKKWVWQAQPPGSPAAARPGREPARRRSSARN
jgi:putative flippase GtrA